MYTRNISVCSPHCAWWNCHVEGGKLLCPLTVIPYSLLVLSSDSHRILQKSFDKKQYLLLSYCGKTVSLMAINCSDFLTTGMFSFDHNLAEANHPYSGDEDVLNEAEVNGNWTPQEKALHEARLKAKAKRRLRKSSSHNSTSESFSESGDMAGTDPNSPKGKVNTNDRKSRTGKGRGLPKKGKLLCWCVLEAATQRFT